MSFDYLELSLYVVLAGLITYDIHATYKIIKSKNLKIHEVPKAIHDFLKRKLFTEPTFPFNRLPLIVRNEVIRSIGYKDCINLALASKKAAETVRMARIKTSYAEIIIRPTAYIDIWDGKVIMFPNHKFNKLKGAEAAEVINSTVLKKWTDQSSDSVVQNTARVYNEMENIFRFEKQFTLVFSSNYKKVTTVAEVLSDPTMKNWGYCTFDGETIELEELNMIMDMASPTRSFACNVKEFPTGFRHENAFKFRDNDYEDARWVKIEDLYELKNCQHVTLERNNFTPIEIKEFISYWVNSEIDMFWWMEIGKVEPFDLTEILDGLTLLDIEHLTSCFAMAPSSETRKKRLLFFSNTEISLTLSAWAPGEFKSGKGEEFDETIRNKEGVIDLLMEKKRLETELESADEESKTILSNRLRQLDDEISNYGVFFVNGKATLRVPT